MTEDGLQRSLGILIETLNVLVIVLCSFSEISQAGQDVCNGAMHVCITLMVTHLLGDLEHPFQMFNGPLRLPLQASFARQFSFAEPGIVKLQPLTMKDRKGRIRCIQVMDNLFRDLGHCPCQNLTGHPCPPS